MYYFHAFGVQVLPSPWAPKLTRPALAKQSPIHTATIDSFCYEIVHDILYGPHDISKLVKHVPSYSMHYPENLDTISSALDLISKDLKSGSQPSGYTANFCYFNVWFSSDDLVAWYSETNQLQLASIFPELRATSTHFATKYGVLLNLALHIVQSHNVSKQVNNSAKLLGLSCAPPSQ